MAMARKAAAWLRREYRMVILLILAAAVMAVGLELLQNSRLAPVFQDGEAELFGITREELEAAGTYLHASGRIAYREVISPRRLAVTFGIQLAVLILLIPMGLGRRMLKAARGLWDSVRRACADRKALAKGGLTFLIAAGAGFLLTKLWAQDALGKSNWMIDVFSACAGICAGVLLTFRKALGKKPEAFFLCFTLMIGGLMAFLLPDVDANSWDEAYHYQHAVNYSTIGRARYTAQDMKAMTPAPEMVYGLGEERAEFLRAQEADYRSGAVSVIGGCHLSWHEFWMAFHGLGIFLGRTLGLSFWMTWSLGRMAGLCAYAMLGYFAVRRLKYGKMTAAAALMIPQQIFLAANYSYDPGVTGFMALGMAYLFAQWQEPEKKISAWDQAVILGGLFFGCLAKQIYFPAALLPLLLPKSKFADAKARKRFLAADLFTAALLVLSFVIPFMTGDGSGDQRGGEGINAFGQVRFILGNPLGYADTLVRFLGRYLNPANAQNWITFFAYRGKTPNTEIYLLILAAAAFTDRGNEEKPGEDRAWKRALGLGLLLSAAVLAATSMYVAFTAVGSDTIQGCQPRYLAPLVFPAMMLIGSGRIRNGMDRGLYHGILLAAMGFAGFTSVLYGCVAAYG